MRLQIGPRGSARSQNCSGEMVVVLLHVHTAPKALDLHSKDQHSPPLLVHFMEKRRLQLICSLIELAVPGSALVTPTTATSERGQKEFPGKTGSRRGTHKKSQVMPACPPCLNVFQRVPLCESIASRHRVLRV